MMTEEQTGVAPGNSDTEDGAERESEPVDGSVGAGDLARIRDLVLAAHPDVVPELIQGTTMDELMASIEPAREAYQRIASQTAAQASKPVATPKVAAQPGQRDRVIADIENLSPLGKISEGLRRR